MYLEGGIGPYDSFDRIKKKFRDINCVVGEPDFVNPNSFVTIIEVLQNIGLRAGIKHYGGGKREWLFVECDGLPYSIIRDLLDNLWQCTFCKDCFYMLTSSKHKRFILYELEPVREFLWIFPILGLLNFEMNPARSFIKLNWDVFTSAFGHELGFKSIKAQEYLRKGFDHDKAWHFIEIVYLSLSLELVKPCVKSVSAGTSPPAEEYWN